MAGLHEVPVVVRECSDTEAAAIALIENIQREDLNPIEEAEGYRTLAGEFGLTHQELADTVGRSRSSVSNTPAPAGAQPRRPRPGRAGRARHGARAGPARALRRRAERDRGGSGPAGLSARETEKLVRSKAKGETAAAGPKSRDPDVVRLETELAERLGAKVRIDHRARGRGSLTIHYSSLEALDGILQRIR